MKLIPVARDFFVWISNPTKNVLHVVMGAPPLPLHTVPLIATHCVACNVPQESLLVTFDVVEEDAKHKQAHEQLKDRGDEG